MTAECGAISAKEFQQTCDCKLWTLTVGFLTLNLTCLKSWNCVPFTATWQRIECYSQIRKLKFSPIWSRAFPIQYTTSMKLSLIDDFVSFVQFIWTCVSRANRIKAECPLLCLQTSHEFCGLRIFTGVILQMSFQLVIFPKNEKENVENVHSSEKNSPKKKKCKNWERRKEEQWIDGGWGKNQLSADHRPNRRLGSIPSLLQETYTLSEFTLETVVAHRAQYCCKCACTHISAGLRHSSAGPSTSVPTTLRASTLKSDVSFQSRDVFRSMQLPREEVTSFTVAFARKTDRTRQKKRFCCDWWLWYFQKVIATIFSWSQHATP